MSDYFHQFIYSYSITVCVIMHFDTAGLALEKTVDVQKKTGIPGLTCEAFLDWLIRDTWPHLW